MKGENSQTDERVWIPSPPAEFVDQDFSDYQRHRRENGSERGTVHDLALSLGVEVVEQTAHAGHHLVPVVIFRPGSGRAVSAAVLYIHGGGHLFGDAYSQADEMVRWASEGLTVTSVDYRL